MLPPAGKFQAVKAACRRLLHRDWYPIRTPCDVQQVIAGSPAMYCAFAWRGKMLAGFAGIPQRTLSESGPSTVVWLGQQAEMAKAAAEMITGLGFTGFVGFDFMLEAATGLAYLLECNPRPIQVSHLGSRIGAGLATALAGALGAAGPAQAVPAAAREAVITLFPQEWQREPAGASLTDCDVDVPWDDPGLLQHMVAACAPEAMAALVDATPPATPHDLHGQHRRLRQHVIRQHN